MPRKLCLSALVALVFVTGLTALSSPSALGQQLDSKRQQAAELEKQISAQGDRLSMADEAYNQAQIQASKVATDAAATRSLADAAEARYGELKNQLAKRVRLLYMHPGAPLDAMLGAKSFAQLERGRVLGSSVLTADTDLVMKTEKARQEVVARAKTLDALRAEASSKARVLSGRRAAVGQEIAAQQALLQNVKGDIAKILEAQRKQELAEAQAAVQQHEEAPQAPQIEPAHDATERDPQPTEVPEGDDAPAPPPPVSGGAGTAVQSAAAQIGKPYEWAAAGPDSFDCSGLTMYAWGKAGVSMAHSAAAQYDAFPHVSRSELQPGDLVFFGSPIHHVGIYEGGGVMINAPQTGEFVRRDSIARADYVGASRP